VAAAVHFFLLSGPLRTLRRSEEALASSEERYRTLVETAQDGVLVLNERGDILEANPSAAELFGMPQGNLRGLSLAGLLGPGQGQTPSTDPESTTEFQPICRLNFTMDDTTWT